MRHRRKRNLIGRPADQRKAILSHLVSALLWHGKIVTTEARAKAARPVAEKLITLAKTDTLAARRQARRFLLKVGLRYTGQQQGKPLIVEGGRGRGSESTAVKRLFEDVAPRYRDWPGGYTRIIRLGARPPRADSARAGRAVRRGDGAVLVKLELVDFEGGR